jgi:hypothetical protein
MAATSAAISAMKRNIFQKITVDFTAKTFFHREDRQEMLKNLNIRVANLH